MTEAEKSIFAECKALYQQMFKTQIDYNKLALCVYGSELDVKEGGFREWEVLRRVLGCLGNERLTYKVLHPHCYIWGLSREKDFVERMKARKEKRDSSL